VAGFNEAVVQTERRHPTGFRHPASANQFSVVMVTVKLHHRTCDTHTHSKDAPVGGDGQRCLSHIRTKRCIKIVFFFQLSLDSF